MRFGRDMRSRWQDTRRSGDLPLAMPVPQNPPTCLRIRGAARCVVRSGRTGRVYDGSTEPSWGPRDPRRGAGAEAPAYIAPGLRTSDAGAKAPAYIEPGLKTWPTAVAVGRS